MSRKKYIFQGKVIKDSEKYYSLVYQDLVDYKTIDEKKIRSDADLKQYLDKTPQTRSEKLYDKLKKTDYHHEVINQNLEKQNKYQLKNKKIITFNKKRIEGIETKFYAVTFAIKDKKQVRYRNVYTGRWIKIK